MPNKKSIIITLTVLIIILGGLFAYHKYYYKTGVIYLPGTSSPDQDTAATSTIDDYNTLMTRGLEYKAKGDAGDSSGYEQAIQIFSEVIKVSEGKYWLPYLNLGNTYRSVGNFIEADKAYEEAMKISGGAEISVYQAKIDSWQMDPSKKPDDVKKLFAEAIANVLDNTNLIKAYAGYLRDRGDKDEAIEQFKILSKMYPDNKAYLEEIEYLGN